ncbi:hypothetical protein M5D96_003357 [Drosophila gunungcola]|uniref:Uncharacterized protein n=1 Tax=Drosophila gunungcola TaxID=103775 RepID=A0A9P9YS46_9MUSC|nr:hypothetical protein M5D96_003357 [Drosophila gunungcola]
MVFQGTGTAGSVHCSLTNPSVSHWDSTTLMYSPSPETAGGEFELPALRRRRESVLVGCIFDLLAELDRLLITQK